MFETAELGRTLSKQEYEAVVPELRTALLKAQARLEGAGFSVVVLINGVAGAGKSETANVLHEWLDARYLVTEAWAPSSKEERDRPELWRYWMWLPPAGRIGLFLGSWYTRPLSDRVDKKSTESDLGADLQRILAFERTLADDDTLIVKLWLHVSQEEQEKRLERLANEPTTRFRVSKREWKDHARYPRFRRVAERAVRETSTGATPWSVIEAADDRFRNVSVGQELLARIEHRLARPTVARGEPAPQSAVLDPRTILDTLELGRRVDKEEYDRRMPQLQARLARLARKLDRQRQSAIILFEGPDAAGKGGAIRRLVWALDARQYRVIPVGPPTDEERAHHYLWRFWRHLPRRGRITIYDRSWYGRVLVERVEGFATQEEWSRAYKEINDFERELSDDGIVLLKFWLQVSADEQLRRFQQREREPWKQHKISGEDYRNRQNANLYEVAAAEMLARNSTEYAPFQLVAANDKRYARLEVLKTLCQRLKDAL